MIVFKDLNSVEPYLKFKLFYEEALSKGQEIIEAVCISSYSVDEKEVDARFINLKEVNFNNLIFYTNYNSPKSMQFISHAQVALTIYWSSINVQIRIKGITNKTDEKISNKHFNSRDDKKNALAIASNQSKKIESYEKFIKIYESTLSKNDLTERPDYWGGFSVSPYYFEFWEGHQSRVNKRFAYELIDDHWNKFFLQP